MNYISDDEQYQKLLAEDADLTWEDFAKKIDSLPVHHRRKNSDEPSTQQFSNEKILEDEIVARIESGKKIFPVEIWRGFFLRRG